MEKKRIGFEGECGFRRFVYWFVQQYSELQPPGGCGGAVTISPIDLSGIGCGGGGVGTTIGAPEPGGIVAQQIIGNMIGAFGGHIPCSLKYCTIYQPAQPLGALPKGGGSGITAITASASVTSPSTASPITSLILGRRDKGAGGLIRNAN